MVRSEMLKRYGEGTYTDGYQVVTSLDSRLQKAANYSLRNGLLEFTRRRGYKGPIQNVEVTDDLLATPFEEWPVEIRELLEQYAPGGLSTALVTAVNENNSASLLLRAGVTSVLP
jgi:penicillin-binding protein 1A